MAKKTIKRRLTDGLHSMYTSLGERVAAIKYSFKKGRVSDKELLAMYEDSWVVKKYIDKTADDMLKHRREFSGDISQDLITKINDTENELKLYDVTDGIYRDALAWASLMGDSLIVAITDCEDEEISTPLELAGESIVRFLVLRKGEYTPSNKIISDIASPDFGKPESYKLEIGNNKLTFHHTRCHRTKLGKHSIKDARKFGVSDINAPYTSIKVFDTAIMSTGDTIQEANVDVIFLPGLNEQISSGQEAKVVEYARVVRDTKSSTNMLLMDAGNSEVQGRYEQKIAQFGGLSDVIKLMIDVVCGALDRPITIFFGKSTSGLSSGEEDNTPYYETLNGLQEARLRPMQNFTDQFILDKLAVNELDKINFTYPLTDSTNKTEEATRFGQYATGFAALVQNGIVNEPIALREMQARGVLTTVTGEDIKQAEEMVNKYELESKANTGVQGWAT